MIHAIGGPVSGERSLSEAKWALRTYQQVAQQAGRSKIQQTRLMQEAHLSRLNASLGSFDRAFRQELPKARLEHARKLEERRQSGRSGGRVQRLVAPELLARRRAAQKMGANKAHRLFAAEPLPPLAQIESRVFKQLTGERVARDRSRVRLAAEGLQHARRRGMPMLLVLYRGGGKYQDEYDNATQVLLDQTLRQSDITKALRSYTVVVLPLRELAALSQLAQLPLYEASGRSSPLLVIADPGGEQLASLEGKVNAKQLSTHLWATLGETRYAKSEQLLAQADTRAALRLLRGLLRSPVKPSLRRRAQQRIHEYRISNKKS